MEIIKKSYNTVLEREKRHIDAVLAFSEKNIPKAVDIWNDITVYYPQGEFVCCMCTLNECLLFGLTDHVLP